MRQNRKIHIKFGVFKSNRLEWVWRVLVWEKVRTLYNKKLPNEEKSDIRTYQNAQKNPDDFLEVQTTLSEDFQELLWVSFGKNPKNI